MLTPDQVQAARTQFNITPVQPTTGLTRSQQFMQKVKGTTQPSTREQSSNPLVAAGQNFSQQTQGHAANIVQDLSEKPSFSGAADVVGNVAGEAGDILGKLFSVANDVVTPKPIRDAVSAFGQFLAKNQQAQTAAADKSGNHQVTVQELWHNFASKNPDLAKNIVNIGGAASLGALPDVNLGEGGSAVTNAVKTGVKAAGQMGADVATGAKNLVSGGTDAATNEAVANIAKQEGGIVAPAKTAAQVTEEAQQKTWDVIKPKLSPGEMNDAAASGKIARAGETGVVTQVPTKADLADVKLARPYVEAADGDPIKTVSNIKQGIADEAAKLREAVGTQGGTFSTSNVKGAINNVKVPLAIKDSAEMTQVNNIKNYVSELANSVDKNPQGALDLAQKFRQGINSEFGENVWGKGTPISNYIKSVNKALNDFISTRLPDGALPDGTKIADSFSKQSKLYDIMDNIQLPKLGEAAINPIEEKPLKVPGPPLSEAAKKFGKEHPIVKGAVKAAGRVAGIGAGVHIIP